MSFLNSVLTSIGTGNPASITPPPAHKKTIAVPTPPATNKSSAPQSNGSSLIHKRKAEQEIPHPLNKLSKITKPSSDQLRRPDRSSTPQTSTKTTSATKSAPPSAAKPTAPAQKAVNAVPSKPPPKGSFADIMAQAKALQQQKPLVVGQIKHHTVVKERMSKARRERLQKEARAQELKAGRGKKLAEMRASPSLSGKLRGEKSNLRKDSIEPEYKGTARPSNTTPAYTGTAGLPSRRGSSAPVNKPSKAQQPRRPVRDEYLATDEEDEGEYSYGADDYYDDYSDASSVMEAGVMDVEEEEQAALRAAKVEDEREMKAEMEAKKAKLERKKKLAALSKSRR